MLKMLKERIIKILGGYTKNEYLKSKQILDWDIINFDSKFNFNLQQSDKSKMRSVGVRFIEDESSYPILINLKSIQGIDILTNKSFAKICESLLSKPQEVLDGYYKKVIEPELLRNEEKQKNICLNCLSDEDFNSKHYDSDIKDYLEKGMCSRCSKETNVTNMFIWNQIQLTVYANKRETSKIIPYIFKR